VTEPVKPSLDPNQLADLLEKAQSALGPGMNLGEMSRRLAETEARSKLMNIKLTILLERQELQMKLVPECWKTDPRVRELSKR
jgi:hypothetical protein